MKTKLLSYALSLLTSVTLFCAKYTVDNQSAKDCTVQYFKSKDEIIHQQTAKQHHKEKPIPVGSLTNRVTQIKVFCPSKPLKGNGPDAYTFDCTLGFCGNTKDKKITISKGGQLFDVKT